jgi:ABC-2 type transport system permease protein
MTPERPRLVRSELLKIFTTNSWWIFGIFMLAGTAFTLLVNVFQANGELADAAHFRQNPPDFSNYPADQPLTTTQMAMIMEEYRRATDVPRLLATSAANVYTSGQLVNLIFIVVLGTLVVTNEYFHQTATATFLTTPRRTRVIISKLGAAIILAAGFWLAVTAINVGVGALNFGTSGYGVPFGEWTIIRSMGMNLLAYVCWALVGVGVGVLIQSQLGATITGAALYLVSWPAASVLFGIIRTYVIKDDWVWNLVVALPGVASSIMVAPERIRLFGNSNAPPWWVGMLVLLGYGLVAGGIGTLITRRRDIS